MATAIDLYKTLRNELSTIYPHNEADAMLRILFMKVANTNLHTILVSKEMTISEANMITIADYVEQLKNHVPLQHIIGETEFMDFTLRVTPDVLIPRPETEELVAWAMEHPLPPNSRILDIGTGSGCIAIALADAFAKAKVFALDISEKALALAQENAQRNYVEVELIQCDILSPTASLMARGPYEMVISNPPYIHPNEKTLMNRNVIDNEPHLALFTPSNDPLLFYRAIAKLAPHLMSRSAILMLEINEAYGQETIRTLCEYGFHTVELRKDINGKDRMIRAYWE